MGSACSNKVVAAWLFWFSVFLIPFDNIPFAPSLGWAAVSPYIFLVFMVLNLLGDSAVSGRVRLSYSAIVFFVSVLVLSTVSYVVFGVSPGPLSLGVAKLALGISFYFSMVIISGGRREWLDVFVDVIFFSYFIALIIGIIQLLDSKLGLGLSGVWDFLLARAYPGKVQFTFTEPSFASVHVFGVIVPVCYLRGRLDRPAKRLLFVAATILLVSIFSGSSLRALVDVLAVAVLASVFFVEARLKVWFVVGFVGVLVFMFMPEYLVDRVSNVLNPSGVLDPSAVIRKFRVDSVLYGWVKSVYGVVFGFGFSNAAVAMRDGLDQAFSVVPLVFDELNEVSLKPDGVVYSMHIKLLVEHGVLGYFCVLFLTFSKRFLFLWFVVLVVYLQFDSMAFYCFWIYLYGVRFLGQGGGEGRIVRS